MAIFFRGFNAALILSSLIGVAHAQTLISFDDIVGLGQLGQISPDRYRDIGVLFTQVNGNPPRVWFCGCPSVQTTPGGGAWSNPNALSGDGAGVSLRARFVLPGTSTPTTVSRVSVYFLSGPSLDPLAQDLSLIGYAEDGAEIVRSTVSPDKQFQRLTVQYPGIASVVMQADSITLEVFDDFEFASPCIPSENCPADFNCDSVVDDADFTGFVLAYNFLVCDDPAMPYGCPADLNSDGVVEDADFVVFVHAYNELLCP